MDYGRGTQGVRLSKVSACLRKLGLLVHLVPATKDVSKRKEKDGKGGVNARFMLLRQFDAIASATAQTLQRP